MGTLLSTFTFDRNTFRRSAAESASSVIQHIDKVLNGEDLSGDKTARNIVGALANYMGIFRRDQNDKWQATRLSERFRELYQQNQEDSWRWLVTRSLWLFVVPNGTECKVNPKARELGLSFSFFQTLAQLTVLLSSLPGGQRFLYFEELCRLFNDDKNWSHPATDLFLQLLDMRSHDVNGFRSNRGWLNDLEDAFDVPRDNLNGLFSKALGQTGFFETKLEGAKSVAIALRSSLEPTLQSRLRFVLDNSPPQFSDDWGDHLDLHSVDLPAEVVSRHELSTPVSVEDPSEINGIVKAASEAFTKVGLRNTETQVLRFVSSLLTKRFLIVTGLAGSGKTKLAQAFAAWISSAGATNDPFKLGSNIAADRVQYFVANADSISVELWNSQDPLTATRVVLPRAMISEWVSTIEANGFSRVTPARAIREATKAESRFSDQLHSFESQLKASAFAQIEATHGTLTAPTYVVVPVGADWIGNENVLGYPDGLDVNRYVSKPTLELFLDATYNRDIPYFLILDEMNLSHVERYFADLLSAIESGEGIPLHSDRQRLSNGRPVPETLVIPRNLFVIGTVNVDETTYMFSPKVLDRANVIEFRMSTQEMSAFLSSPRAPDLDALRSQGQAFGRSLVLAAQSETNIPETFSAIFQEQMALFFASLQDHGVEFGYRTARDASRLVYFVNLLLEPNRSELSDFYRAFDFVIVQKFLPKLHGSRAQLAPLLKQLWFICSSPLATPILYSEARDAASATDRRFEPSLDAMQTARYPVAAEKIGRMWRLLNENGFTSFAEA